MSDFNNWKEVKKYLEIESNEISFKDGEFAYTFNEKFGVKYCNGVEIYRKTIEDLNICMTHIISLADGDESIIHKS